MRPNAHPTTPSMIQLRLIYPTISLHRSKPCCNASPEARAASLVIGQLVVISSTARAESEAMIVPLQKQHKHQRVTRAKLQGSAGAVSLADRLLPAFRPVAGGLRGDIASVPGKSIGPLLADFPCGRPVLELAR